MNIVTFGITRDIIERISREASDGAHHGARMDEWATYQDDRRLSARSSERPVCREADSGGPLPVPLKF